MFARSDRDYMEAYLQLNYISIIFLLLDKTVGGKSIKKTLSVVFCSSQIMSLQQCWTSDLKWAAHVGVLSMQHCLVTQVGSKARRLKHLTLYNMNL